MIKELEGKIVSPDKANFKNTEGFRLPTEVEWEWFAKGGQKAIEQGTFEYKYSGSNNIDEVAWYYENSGAKNEEGTTQNVGLKEANQLGLYDCSGNIYEWCYDTGRDGYISKKIPYIYDETEDNRRLKGGSRGWIMSPLKEYEISFRYNNICYVLSSNFGFRIVRTI